MKKQRLVSALLLAALLSGCSLIPTYERPGTDSPAAWSENDATSPTAIARDWWKDFNSPELDALMARALTANNDIGAAIQRVEQARGLARAAGASRFPSANASGTFGYQDYRPNEGRDISDVYGDAGLGVAYELDLFGANRAEREAAEADVIASAYDRDAISLVIMGDVAKGYFNVLNLQERLQIADKNLESSSELLRIVQARFDAGATTALDVSQQKAEYSNTEASRASIEQQLKIARSALAVLVGTPPQSLQIAGKDMRALNVPAISPGQPSTLLERRPDIRSLEQTLISANADIGAARAAFYPNVTLGLNWTVAASPLGDPATTTLALASAIAAPIFTGGLLEGNLDFTKARKAELMENYRKTVLVSFKEVEDAIAGVNASQKRESALSNALSESRKAYDLSTQQYDVGSIDFQTLLDTRRTMLTAEDTYIQTKNERLAAAVDLYKALGGGWSEDGKTAPAASAPQAPAPSVPEPAPFSPAKGSSTATPPAPSSTDTTIKPTPENPGAL